MPAPPAEKLSCENPRHSSVTPTSAGGGGGTTTHPQNCGLRPRLTPPGGRQLPDGILAEHEARRSFRPDAVHGREFLVGWGGFEPPHSGFGFRCSATELSAYLNSLHTAESNVETIKIFIFAYLRIVQIV